MLAAVLILCTPRIDATVQRTGTLRITVTIVDANQRARPVPL